MRIKQRNPDTGEIIDDMIDLPVDLSLDEYKQNKMDLSLTLIDTIGTQLVESDLANLELKSENKLLGQQLVAMDLRLLEGGI